MHVLAAPPSSNAQQKTMTLVVQNRIIIHDNSRSHTAAADRVLLRHWQWEILEHPPYSRDKSPFYYDFFAKMKEPLRGTRCKTRDALIRAIGRSIRNIKKCTILKVNKCYTPVNKAMSEILNCCHYFYPTLVDVYFEVLWRVNIRSLAPVMNDYG